MNNDVTLKSILLLAANPKGTKSLRLQEEEREIKEKLRLAGYGRMPINSTGATRPRDIYQALLDFKPQIVHFSGHGTGHDGLVFEDITGQEKLVGSEALANLFKLFSNHVECVILNACYSRFQAEAIAKHIRYVIGMSRAIGDRAAIEFAVGFYTALGAEESIDFAYELGCNAIQLEGIPEHLTPVLYRDGELILSYPNKSEQPTEETHTQNIVYSAAFSPDGKLLASGSDDKTVKLWNVATGEVLKTLEGHQGAVYSIAFSPDGKLLASSGGDTTVKLWDVAEGRDLRTLTGPKAAVISSIAFSPDGKILASGSHDSTVRLWDVATGKSLKTLEGHIGWVTFVAFHPDGKIIASGGDSSIVKFWDVTTVALIPKGKAK